MGKGDGERTTGLDWAIWPCHLHGSGAVNKSHFPGFGMFA